ncbi:UNVERIFIED_CONTAM: hypothetical protein FKN15_049420 [Acipenser sinensis]
MECVKVGKSNKRKAGVCACKNAYEVCGSDGVTYTNDCELRAASIQAKNTKQAEITQLHKGLCERGMSNGWLIELHSMGSYSSLCGFEKTVVETKKGVEKMELLPGDRDNLAIQTRGGPEKHEVTGWVLISPLSKNEAGGYECHALNSKGVAMASGRINVVDSLDEIPSSKSK